MVTKSDQDVRGVAFAHCNFPSGFPRDLAMIFPNIDHIAINGGLQQISKDDLAGYENLKFLDLQGCEIKTVPNDLFVNTPKLEVVYFSYNRIAIIGQDLLDPLQNLKYIDFRGNVNIDEVYDEDKGTELTLDGLKKIINEQCGVSNVFLDNKNSLMRVSGAK